MFCMTKKRASENFTFYIQTVFCGWGEVQSQIEPQSYIIFKGLIKRFKNSPNQSYLPQPYLKWPSVSEDQSFNFDRQLFRTGFAYTLNNFTTVLLLICRFKTRCPLKGATKQNFQLIGTKDLLLYPFCEALFINGSVKEKTRCSIYRCVPFLKWKPMKVIRLVKLKWPPFWLGMSQRLCSLCCFYYFYEYRENEVAFDFKGLFYKPNHFFNTQFSTIQTKYVQIHQ